MTGKKNGLRKVGTNMLTIVALMLTMASGHFACSYAASDDNNLYLKGTVDYAAAYEVINYVNSERSKHGAPALTVDSALMDCAMTRAAECVFLYEHARPNGGSWDSINSKITGENLCVGSPSAQHSVELWMGSKEHRENILRRQFGSIGVGCFVYDGVHYWAQCFADGGGDGVQDGETKEGSIGIDLPNDNSLGLTISLLHDKESGDVKMEVGSKCDLSVTADGYKFDSSKIDWKVSNPKVASVDEDGKLEVVGMGDTEIKAVTGDIERGSFKLTGEINLKNALVLEALSKRKDIGTRTYTGENITPQFIVLRKGKPLREGIDYEVNYTDNKEVGTATAVISGRNGYTGTVVKTFDIVEDAAE